MIVGTLTVCYRDHRIPDDEIEGVTPTIYEAMTLDLELGDMSTIQAYEVPTASGKRVTVVKNAIRSVSFTLTGDAPPITLPRWTRRR